MEADRAGPPLALRHHVLRRRCDASEQEVHVLRIDAFLRVGLALVALEAVLPAEHPRVRTLVRMGAGDEHALLRRPRRRGDVAADPADRIVVEPEQVERNEHHAVRAVVDAEPAGEQVVVFRDRDVVIRVTRDQRPDLRRNDRLEPGRLDLGSRHGGKKSLRQNCRTKQKWNLHDSHSIKKRGMARNCAHTEISRQAT